MNLIIYIIFIYSAFCSPVVQQAETREIPFLTFSHFTEKITRCGILVAHQNIKITGSCGEREKKNSGSPVSVSSSYFYFSDLGIIRLTMIMIVIVNRMILRIIFFAYTCVLIGDHNLVVLM